VNCELNSKSDLIRILLVEDNPGDVRLLREALREAGSDQFHLTHVTRLSDAMARLEDASFDVILTDLSLPDCQGLEACTRLHERVPKIPIVVLTGTDDEANAVEALHKGAQDYLVKGRMTAGYVLARALRYAIERHRLRCTLEQTQERQLRVKDDFLSHVSHELRSPLAAVHQFVSIVLDRIAGDLTPEQTEYLQIALKNVDQLRVMIDDLFEAMKMDAGKLSLECAWLAIGELIEEALKTVQKRADDKGIQLSAEVPSELPEVWADRHRVMEILTNLLTNAIKYTPAGGSVSVHAATVGDDASFLCVSVKDTGWGIAPKDHKRIFERLYQVPGINSSSRRGLGLGLHICQQLVHLHGGRIWVESAVGRGSTFSFTLPLHPRVGNGEHSLGTIAAVSGAADGVCDRKEN
jgi:signal transduction histidine kinase